MADTHSMLELNPKDHLHPEVAEALEQIDAALFSGDPAETPEMLQIFCFYVERWKRKLDSEIEEQIQGTPV